MEITYRTVGDYKIPNLDLPEEAKVSLGRWGTAHKDYLRYHRPVNFTTMLADGTLWKHLHEVDEQAKKMFNQLVKEICEDENINEELKARDQICWVRSMNNVYNRATELVNHELIYT
jgi:hypothetical protein